MIEAARELSFEVGVKPACEVLGVSRASYYRRQSPNHLRLVKTGKASTSPRALSHEERQDVLDTLHSERFVDKAPYSVYASLLDEGRYLCSIRTMYRILEANEEVRERRKQRSHPNYEKPELLAKGPNEVWSWDITKLKGPVKWSCFHLYVILDIFSRCVVGWMVAHRESADLAKKLIQESCEKQGIERGRLILHADRGSSMKSKAVALLLSDLGVTKTHSRPHTSNDNPYSESQFKTMKYRPEFPKRFGSIEDARSFCQDFFGWYNKEHRHSGIGLFTPEDVHYGRTGKIHQQRQEALLKAYQLHPERFVKKIPEPPELPKAAWINKPKGVMSEEALL